MAACGVAGGGDRGAGGRHRRRRRRAAAAPGRVAAPARRDDHRPQPRAGAAPRVGRLHGAGRVPGEPAAARRPASTRCRSAVLAKRPLVHFDLRNEEGHSIPLLTAEQNTHDRPRAALPGARRRPRRAGRRRGDAGGGRAGGRPGDRGGARRRRATPATMAELERDHGLAPLTELPRDGRDPLARLRPVGGRPRPRSPARVQVRLRRAVLPAPGLTPTYFYDAPGCTEAWSYHVEVAVPQDLKARTTQLLDDGDRRGARHRRARRRPARALLLRRPGASAAAAAGRRRLRRRARAVPRPGRDRRHGHRAARGARRGCSPICRRWRTAPARRSASCSRRRRCSPRSCCGPTSTRSAAAAARPLPPEPGGEHARRAVRRRRARVPGGRLGHRRHVGGRRACLRPDRRYPVAAVIRSPP